MVDKNIEMAKKIAAIVAQKGGSTYYVGGFVRDQLRKKPNKDVDIEIHGIRPGELENILDSLGERQAIGESFGIFNIKGYDLDIAMPRKEENRGSGHKDFDVFVDPFIGTYKAAIRRDFTINALMQDVLTGEIVDHFGGVNDLTNGVIRHVNDTTFREDPLRVLRAAQFAARFEYEVADETIDLCKQMDLSALPNERIMGELGKALLKSKKPSIFFESLRRMNQLSVWFPELEQTIGIEQNHKYHAEGDVWTHTMMVLDEAVQFRDKVGAPLGFMLAAVTHDFGKAVCTEMVDGEWHAYKHEELGMPLIRTFMKRLTNEKDQTKYVLNLSKLHMRPHMLATAKNATIKASNRMFDASVDPQALICLALADSLGKIDPNGYVSDEVFFDERLAIYNEYMSRPYVMGRDLIDAGLEPSERFTKYLKLAHKLRIAGVEKDIALRQVLALARELGDIPNNTDC